MRGHMQVPQPVHTLTACTATITIRAAGVMTDRQGTALSCRGHQLAAVNGAHSAIFPHTSCLSCYPAS